MILSSHLLPDVERVCDHAIVVVKGKLRAEGPIQELKKIEGRPVDVELREASGAFVEAATAWGLELLQTKHLSYRFKGPGTPEEMLRQLFQIAAGTGAQIRGYAVAERSLEDAFLEAVHG